ncbi:MAG: prepilin-type N-terminal cleavage/methylation domain-containing protein [Patescibacteria group bacterium]
MMFKYKNLLTVGKRGAGFSLVEMLVAIAVFMILTVILSGIYVAFNRNQNRANVSQKMVNNLQYVFEIVSRQIRDNSIVDFSSTCPIAGYTDSCILLQREDGSLFAFAHNDQALEYLLINKDAGGAYAIINEPGSSIKFLSPDVNNIKVDLARFYIQPSINPYLQGGSNQQPKVTVALQVVYSGTGNVSSVYNIQTTVSSRIYKR